MPLALRVKLLYAPDAKPPIDLEGNEEEVNLADEGTIMGEFQKERTDAISEMFDNVDSLGIYPTTKCFVRLDKAFRKAIFRHRMVCKEFYQSVTLPEEQCDETEPECDDKREIERG